MVVLRVAPFALLAGLFVIVGCGGPKLVEVKGTLKQNGKPLNGIQVEFWPVETGPRSMGTTDDQGRFTLLVDDGLRKGAVVGPHKVVLRDVWILGDKFLGRAGEDVDMTKGKKPRLAEHYGDPHKTPLKKDVINGPNVIDLEVTP